MTFNSITIRTYTSDGDYIHRSPNGIKSSGIRLRIGWFIMRIGAKIMFNSQWIE